MQNKMPESTHTLIISDLHLGSRVSRVQEATELLKKIKFRKLILLGDIFESLDFERLDSKDWEFISLIGKISKDKKVVWVEGNHDKGLIKVFAGLTGSKVYKIYKWKYQKRKYLAIHGHQFDNFLINNVFLSFLANQLYNFVQLVDFKDKRISRFIKRKSKGWLRLSETVARRALLFGKINLTDYIFCGHTHQAFEKKSKKIKYYNCGCWTDQPCGYLTLDKNKAEIHHFV